MRDLRTFGHYIGRKRLELDLSQDEVCKVAGISKASYSDLENGKPQDFKVSTLIGLSKALKVPIPNLILAFEGKDPDRMKEAPIKNPEIQEMARAILKAIPPDMLKKFLEELKK